MDAYQERIIRWRRDLHQIPELGNLLPQTVAYVDQVLADLGLERRYLVDGNAITAVIEGTKPGTNSACIGLRADMDALPIEELTGLPFASKNGCMHACGHDAHTAMLLGAASYLQAHRDRFSGRVKLLFQPGEESPGGAKPMVDEGAMEDPKVTAVFGLHCGNISSESPPGSMSFRPGPMMAAVDILKITVKGKGGHGAFPQDSIDPIPVASELVLALQRLISRERHPMEPAVLSICSIHGGDAHNIIPESVVLEGNIRSFSPELRLYYKERIQEICDGLALSHRLEIIVDHQMMYPALHNDPGFTKLAMQAAAKVYGDAGVLVLEQPVLGSEDMSYFLEAAKGSFAFLCNPKAIKGAFHPHHSPYFAIDEGELAKGAMVLVQVALDYLAKEEA